VTIAKVKSTQRLVAVDREAAGLGLKAGQTLADARAMYPGLCAEAADPRGEAATLAELADWCRRFTPLAALDAPNGIMLDVTGATHLFGGEEKLVGEIATRLAAQGFWAQAAIAATPEAAWALARFGKTRIAAADLTEAALVRLLGPLPLAALRLDAALLGGLAQAGLRRIDDILLRPRAPLTARFGPHLHARLDALLGRSKTPISPRFEAPAYIVEQRFAEPLMRREPIEASLLALAEDLGKLLTRHGEGARRLEASLFRCDGKVHHIEIGTSRPLRDPALILRLFREKIEAASALNEDDPLERGYGFDVIRLAVLAAEPQDQDQIAWDVAWDAAWDDGFEAADLAKLIDRLGARLGLRRVTRLRAHETHVPEFAVAAIPAAYAPKLPALFVDPPTDGVLPARPLRLLQRPEPIETLAEVPDGPPLQFRWRRVLHHVVAIEGPERIAPEWWREEADFIKSERDAGGKPGSTFPHPALTRDYFRAENAEGQRFWLYREGLFSPQAPRPRWFMHGFFA